MAEGKSFPVRVPSALATKLSVQTEMFLVLECEHVTLVNCKGIHTWTWSIEHLRRYGYAREDFHFEAGSRCQTGEGYFAFNTLQGRDIFNVVQDMKAAHKQRKKIRSRNSADRPPVRTESINCGKIQKSKYVREKEKSLRKIIRSFSSLSFSSKRKPKDRKQEETMPKETITEEKKKKRSSVVSADYVTVLSPTPRDAEAEAKNKHQLARRIKTKGDAWKHFGY
ncbi:docking protein 6-like [Penaeus japonicus]|uniref:docking protein 6-like n=1 Tax=Penaeus japonicus TaxID=27405 RepID=UPI001C70C29E|nr:docking protein 6-like [Penaeus japonicus]